MTIRKMVLWVLLFATARALDNMRWDIDDTTQGVINDLQEQLDYDKNFQKTKDDGSWARRRMTDSFTIDSFMEIASALNDNGVRRRLETDQAEHGKDGLGAAVEGIKQLAEELVTFVGGDQPGRRRMVNEHDARGYFEQMLANFDEFVEHLGGDLGDRRRMLGFHCTDKWTAMHKACKNEKRCVKFTNVVSRAQCLATHIDSVSKECSDSMSQVYECMKCRPQLAKATRECDAWMKETCSDDVLPKDRVMCLLANRSEAPAACDAAATQTFKCATTHKVSHKCLQREGLIAWTVCHGDIHKFCGDEKTFAGLDKCMVENADDLSKECKYASGLLRSCIECGSSKAMVVYECHEPMTKVCPKAHTTVTRKACYINNYMRFSGKCQAAVSNKVHICSKYDHEARHASRSKLHAKHHRHPKGGHVRRHHDRCGVEREDVAEYCGKQHKQKCGGRSIHGYRSCIQEHKSEFTTHCVSWMDRLETCQLRGSSRLPTKPTSSGVDVATVLALLVSGALIICLAVYMYEQRTNMRACWKDVSNQDDDKGSFERLREPALDDAQAEFAHFTV